MNNEHNGSHAWVKLYHHCGALVSIPVPVLASSDGVTPTSARSLFDQITNLITAGFTNDPPRLGEDEQKIVCRWLVRRSRVAEDQTVVPIIDLYMDEDRMTFACLTVYLNSQADIDACKKATGVNLEAFPEYIGQGKLEKVPHDPRIMHYFARFVQPVNVIRKKNPNYNPDEPDIKKRKPQWRFVRWADLSSDPTKTQPAQEPAHNNNQPAPAPAPAQAQGVDAKALAAMDAKSRKIFIAKSAQAMGGLMASFDFVKTPAEANEVRTRFLQMKPSMTIEDIEAVNHKITLTRQRLTQPAPAPQPVPVPDIPDDALPDPEDFNFGANEEE